MKEKFMRKHFKKVISLLFIIAYVVLLSVGAACMLNLSGAAFAIALDGGSVVNKYPRFIPFCFVIGILALTALVFLFVLNVKASKKLDYTKTLWFVQSLAVFAVSIPMIKLWETLFLFLQKTF